jgi:D-glycero-D-manno-heptose 1,7-bisphosphate phosphatase
MEKIVFLDRDGVINIEKDYLYKIEDFDFIEGTFESLLFLQDLGFKLVIVTNQSGIARGYYTQEDFDILTHWMIDVFKAKGIEISAVFLCPHGPNDNCECRKPKTGMIQQTRKIFEIDFENSWLVGDKDSDIQMAINAGIAHKVQVRSGHDFDQNNSKADFIIDSIKELPDLFQ